MTTASNIFHESQQFGGKLKPVMRIAALLPMAIGCYVLILSLSDRSLEPIGRVALLLLIVVPVGVLIPIWLWRWKLSIDVDRDSFRVMFWPFRSRVPLDTLENADVVVVDAMRDYGGWGLKGSRADLFYSVGGHTAIRLRYHNGADTRHLTVTSEHSEEIGQILQRFTTT